MIYVYLFFTLPALCVQSWIEKFNKDLTTNEDFDAFLHYKQLSEVFSTFFLMFYSILQFLSIVVIFSSIAKFVNQDSEIDIDEYLLFCGYMLGFGEWVDYWGKKCIDKKYYVRKQHSKPHGSDMDSGVCLRLSAESDNKKRGKVAEDNGEIRKTETEI